MPYPLPKLETGGVDVTNTLAKIEAMKAARASQANTESEIAAREQGLTLRQGELGLANRLGESTIADRTSQNALRLVQAKREQALLDIANRDATSKLFDNFTRDATFITGLPEEAQEGFYSDMLNSYKEKGINAPLPASTVFYKNGKWNALQFKGAQEALMRAKNFKEDPSFGKTEELVVLNEEFDPTKDDSSTNPRWVKARFISKGVGQTERATKFTPVPVQLAYENEEQKQKIEKDKAAETARHNKEIETIQKENNSDAKLTRAETERYHKAMEKISAKEKVTWYPYGTAAGGKKIVMTSSEGKVSASDVPDSETVVAKSTAAGGIAATFTNPNGLTVVQDKQGKFLVPDIVNGEPGLRPATPKEVEGITKLGTAPDPLEKAFADRISGKKVGGGNTPAVDIKALRDQANAAIRSKQSPLSDAQIRLKFKSLTGEDL